MPDCLYSVLAECLESVERGLPAHYTSVCARHPEYKAEIEQFLSLLEWIARLTAGLRHSDADACTSQNEPACLKQDIEWKLGAGHCAHAG
jgi:hypothetical protein